MFPLYEIILNLIVCATKFIVTKFLGSIQSISAVMFEVTSAAIIWYFLCFLFLLVNVHSARCGVHGYGSQGPGNKVWDSNYILKIFTHPIYRYSLVLKQCFLFRGVGGAECLPPVRPQRNFDCSLIPSVRTFWK